MLPFHLGLGEFINGKKGQRKERRSQRIQYLHPAIAGAPSEGTGRSLNAGPPQYPLHHNGVTCLVVFYTHW